MAEDHNEHQLPTAGEGATAVHLPKADAKQQPADSRKVTHLPQYKVLLHDDPVNDIEHVVLTILKITSLSLAMAQEKTMEAHRTGISLILVTHKERAELYQEQFGSYNLTVTIEPDAS